MKKWLYCLVVLLACSVPAHAVNLQLGVSDDTIPINSSFSGKDITIFGTIEDYSRELLRQGKYQVVAEVIGPKGDVVMRKKDRVLGIWVNRESRRFANIPTFYLTAANFNIMADLGKNELKELKLGVDNIPTNLLSSGRDTHFQPAPKFSNALRRLRVKEGLYGDSETAMQFLGPTLFRVSIPIPANVPLGVHTVKAYLFQDGKFVSSSTTKYRVLKTGFEQWVYTVAYEHGLIYGIVAVLLAITTGWMANVIFRKD